LRTWTGGCGKGEGQVFDWVAPRSKRVETTTKRGEKSVKRFENGQAPEGEKEGTQKGTGRIQHKEEEKKRERIAHAVCSRGGKTSLNQPVWTRGGDAPNRRAEKGGKKPSITLRQKKRDPGKHRANASACEPEECGRINYSLV